MLPHVTHRFISSLISVFSYTFVFWDALGNIQGGISDTCTQGSLKPAARYANHIRYIKDGGIHTVMVCKFVNHLVNGYAYSINTDEERQPMQWDSSNYITTNCLSESRCALSH